MLLGVGWHEQSTSLCCAVQVAGMICHPYNLKLALSSLGHSQTQPPSCGDCGRSLFVAVAAAPAGAGWYNVTTLKAGVLVAGTLMKQLLE